MSSCAICGKEVVEQFPAKCLECSTILCDMCAMNNQFKCNTCRGDIIGRTKEQIQTVRRSYIELYKKCPHSFYLKVCKGVDTHSSVYAQIGIFLHEIFDRTAKAGCFGRMDEDAIKDGLIQEWDVFFKGLDDKDFDGCQRKLTTEEFKIQQYQKGINNINGFITLCKSRVTPWKSEETVEIIVPNTNIKATMTFDRIDEINGEYELVDYKTGQVYVGQKLNDDLQPALYIAGVEQTYGIKIKRFTFLFTGEEKVRTYERIGEDTFETYVGKKAYGFCITEKLNEVSEIFNRIEKNEFDIPSDLHPWHCQNECELYKALACPGKFYEQWKQA